MVIHERIVKCGQIGIQIAFRLSQGFFWNVTRRRNSFALSKQHRNVAMRMRCRPVYWIESWSELEREWRIYSASQRLRSLAHHSLQTASTDQTTALAENDPERNPN
jgi:hypothetical protein